MRRLLVIVLIITLVIEIVLEYINAYIGGGSHGSSPQPLLDWIIGFIPFIIYLLLVSIALAIKYKYRVILCVIAFGFVVVQYFWAQLGLGLECVDVCPSLPAYHEMDVFFINFYGWFCIVSFLVLFFMIPYNPKKKLKRSK